MAQKVSEFKRYLLTVKAFVNWLILVHWVSRQISEIFEWISALQQPLNFEVWHELQLVLVHSSALRTVLLVNLVLLETLHFVVGVRLALHSGDALETPRFIDGEYQNDIFNSSESVTQLL
jgi:hypothetical protein